jgi:hypothetical protein
VYFFDSMGGSIPHRTRELLDTALDSPGLRDTGWNVHTEWAGPPMQQDDFQCGVWALTVEQWFREWIEGMDTTATTWQQ